MANIEHLARIKDGVDAWNDWRKANPEIVPDLSKEDLTGANLNAADLRYAQLEGTDLSKVNLRGIKLGSAHLRDADLTGADLSEAVLFQTDMSNVELGGAKLIKASLILTDLRIANLNDANLNLAAILATSLTAATMRGTDLTGATVSEAVFADVDLSTVKGLETVHHGGPSTIGIDTIYKSGRKIPEAFLRGAGVPDNFIEYMGSLTGKALEFYSCFISYSTKNQDFANRLYADLQNKGVRCWFAPHDAQGGKKLHEQIDEAIRRYERLLLILSPSSMNSEWVETEIRKARKRERTEKKRVLFPVRLVSFEAIRDWELFDADEGKDLAAEICEYYIPDFSNWKNHDHYAKEFKKLLRDLKTEGSKAA